MTNILFTHSYFLKFDPKEYQTMMPYPPLGTLYAAAAAREAGYSIAFFDAMLADSESEITEHLTQHVPRFLVIYDDDFNYLTKMCLERMRKAAFAMAALGKQHGCTVIVHSSDATDHLANYFDHDVDYILIGEAERTLCELLDILTGKNQREPNEIAGVACRNSSGMIERGPKREVMRELDALPFPARDLIDIECYRDAWQKKHGYFSLNMVTTRGCPYHCNWCAKPLYGQVYNSHSPGRIAEELADIKRRFQPDHIWFCDDIFGLKPEWIAEFSREVERLDVSIPFKCLSRADLLLHDGIIDTLRRAGCRSVWIGAESGAQKILDAMEKGITVEQIYRATMKLRDAGIHVGFFLQFGYPGEEWEEIEKTLEMVRRAMPDEIGISVSYPLPGTKFYERVRSEMGAKRNWSESADLAMMFQGAYSTDFYRTLSKFVHKDHRMRQGMQTLRTFTRTFRIPARSEIRRMLLTPYYFITRNIFYLSMKKLQQPEVREEILLPVVESR